MLLWPQRHDGITGCAFTCHATIAPQGIDRPVAPPASHITQAAAYAASQQLPMPALAPLEQQGSGFHVGQVCIHHPVAALAASDLPLKCTSTDKFAMSVTVYQSRQELYAHIEQIHLLLQSMPCLHACVFILPGSHVTRAEFYFATWSI